MSATPRFTPVLVYSDIEAAHTFLVDTFGFEAGSLHRSEDGQVVHGEVHVDGASIWLHRETADHGLASPQSHHAAFGGLAVLVDDVDAHYERARAAGAVIGHAPQDQPYGRREYGVLRSRTPAPSFGGVSGSRVSSSRSSGHAVRWLKSCSRTPGDGGHQHDCDDLRGRQCPRGSAQRGDAPWPR